MEKTEVLNYIDNLSLTETIKLAPRIEFEIFCNFSPMLIFVGLVIIFISVLTYEYW